MVGRKLAISNIPAKRRQLHQQDHLRACDVNGPRIVGSLSLNMADGHVAHKIEEANPWHVRAGLEVVGYAVGANRADSECADTIDPQIEDTYEVK